MPSTASPFEARGPYAVGALQTQIDSPSDSLDPRRTLPCEIWYPAMGPPAQDYDAPHPLSMPHLASLDIAPITTPCGLIAFSHGNSGFRQQSTFLTTHLASWGFVVVAPDHVGNTFPEMLGIKDEEKRKAIHLRARTQRPQDLAQAIRALLDEGLHAEGLPPLDSDRLGVLGHSFGGWTALKVPALERRTKSVCALAPASEPFVGRKAFEPNELPLSDSLESLVLAARQDVLVDLETSILPLVARLGSNNRLEIIDGADHFHFCDGLELLHKMHENTPRTGQKRPTTPLADLQGERTMHTWLNERIARFFHTTLDGAQK
jgi:dienelactone hydrolase